MAGIGDFVHLVSLAKAGPTPDDPAGGYDRTWIALDPPTWYCSITAATARDLERFSSGGAFATTATHLIRGRYHAQLASDCRITFRDRVFEVGSVQIEDEQQTILNVIATELIGQTPTPVTPQQPAPHAPTHQPGGTDPIGPQPPLAHAATHGVGGTDPIPAAPLPSDVAIAGSLAVGTNPAQSGAVRLAENQEIKYRRSDNTTDVTILNYTSWAAFIAPMFNTSIYVGNGDNPIALRGYVVVAEMTAPAAPAANGANLWLQDNGAGKSQLMIQFATGAPVAIATEP